MWAVEFYHGYFGWLRYDREFPTREAAVEWKRYNPSPYPQRVLPVLPCRP